MMVEKVGDVYAALYGVLRVLRPSPYKAGLFAVKRAIEVGIPPLNIFTDCASLIEAFAKGPRFC